MGVWVRSASIHETREQMGISHLLEHLVFKGTKRRTAKEIAMALEARGGSLDAYTSREHTSFQAYVLERDLPVAIDVLHDLVVSPLLREEDLQLERNVILDEIAGVEDTPDDVVFEEHNSRLWGDHPYGYTILGTRQSVTDLSIDRIRDRHAGAFRSENMVIALGGNVDHESVCKLLLAAGWGETVSNAANAAAPVVPPPPQPQAPSQSAIARDTHQAHIVLGSTTIPMKDPSRPALLVVSTLFGSGMSSRLFQRVREELGLAYAVYGYQSLYSDVGIHGVYVGTAPDTAQKARDAVIDELKRLVDHGVGEEELALGRQQLVGQFLLSLESAGSRMQRAASCELYGEPFRSVDEVIQRIESVTTADALAVAQKWFAPERQTILTLGPT
jgi:predicted Zn-dependent peptidase